MRTICMTFAAILLVCASSPFAQTTAPLGERFISLCRLPTDADRDACGGRGSSYSQVPCRLKLDI